MKQMMAQFAAYNYWANQKIFEMLNSLPQEKQKQQLASSFPTIKATLLHMWDASSAWWQRIKLQERLVLPSENFQGTVAELTQQMLQQDQLYADWNQNATDAALDHVIQYYNSKKEYFKQPVWQVMLHAFNHSTYHRGQLVTMLRQLGIEKIPQTDFVVFTRKK